ncbi:Asp-tRNA(Asn)/Glu-tRNA(Gln) amidotransferase subunit GatC [Candidatus Saccharibacteria bacterium]|nr:Asp-tRNA(Asn)/Glu-tRNA(Gln) amidotransferase subunit GatC [Candidatus Saccharibacteria bacterium]
MKTTREEIKHLAQLSNFSVTEEEAEGLTKDIDNILKYISKIEELDTKDVKPTFQCIEMQNVWRPDEILPQDANREELLALTKEEKDNQIKVPKVL